MLALRRTGRDWHLDSGGAGAAQADDEGAAAVIVIASHVATCGAMDCFVAEPVIGPAQEGRTRWLLALTTNQSFKCRAISGRAFSAAPCFAMIFAIRSGAKFMSTNPVAVLATS